MEQKYLTYTIEELAADPAFIQWVREDTPWLELQELISNEPSFGEKAAAARELVHLLHFEVDDVSADFSSIWEAVEKSTSPYNAKVISHPGRTWKWVGGIAMTALLLMYLFVDFSGQKEIQAHFGERISYQLPDGSRMTLNDGSSSTFSSRDWSRARTVAMEGEVYFDVEKGSPFVVRTAMGRVEVLGTTFNVYHRSGDFRVYCYTGIVRVTWEGQEHILEPGEWTEVVGNELVLKSQGPLEAGWISGVQQFEEETLQEVFAEVERQFDVEVSCSRSTAEMLYTGFFSDQDLEAALEAVCWPLHLSWTTNDKLITIEEDSIE